MKAILSEFAVDDKRWMKIFQTNTFFQISYQAPFQLTNHSNKKLSCGHFKLPFIHLIRKSSNPITVSLRYQFQIDAQQFTKKSEIQSH